MQATLPLGNDIVDLKLPDNRNSAANRRYAERVLAPDEMKLLTGAAWDDRVLWTCWAAKEAAYKALVKTDPKLIFAHRRFLVCPETTDAFDDTDGRTDGVVRYETEWVPVTWHWTDDWVHCQTGLASEQSWQMGLVEDYRATPAFNELQQSSQLPDASVVSRLLAYSLLRDHGAGDVGIVRERAARRRAPWLERQGQPVRDLDISLSHDGRYAAAAIRRLI